MNLFFHKCPYKNSCFIELAYSSSFFVLQQSNDLKLEIQKRRSYLKNVTLDFVLLVLKFCFIQVVISLPLCTKLTIGQLLLFFLCNFCSCFSYVEGIHVTNHSSLLLIDTYILAIQQIITHKEHLRYSFWFVAIF